VVGDTWKDIIQEIKMTLVLKWIFGKGLFCDLSCGWAGHMEGETGGLKRGNVRMAPVRDVIIATVHGVDWSQVAQCRVHW
jgi:hypothetical protein